MANAISAIKEQFTSAEARTAYNTALDSHGLPTLSTDTPVRRHCRQLAGAARYPALAVELGDIATTDEGAGGLRSMRGVATLYLALGRESDADWLNEAEAMADALREAVEGGIASGFQRLVFDGAEPEGAVYREAGVPLRLVPVRFRFQWLYQTGEY